MESFDFVTFFFFVAAVLIIIQLRSVLGKRTGNERPPFDPYSAPDRRQGPAQEDGKIVTLPRRQESVETRYLAIDKVADPGSPLNEGLRAVKDRDPDFDPASFLAGAKSAYEMIVAAFAEGDRKTLKSLLSPEVYEGFVAAIDEREKKGETVQSSFVGIEKAEIASAAVKGREAQITVHLVSQLISATLNANGEVVEGDPETVSEVKDVWTFARDTMSRDPNWKLIATEAED